MFARYSRTTRRGRRSGPGFLAALLLSLAVTAGAVFSQDTAQPVSPDAGSGTADPSQTGVLAGAAVVAPGVASDEQVFDETGQVHWYRFEAVAGQIYTFTAETVGASDGVAAGLVLEIYAADGQTLLGTKETAGDGGSVPLPPAGERLAWTCLESGAYLVKVRPDMAQGDVALDAAYTLNLEFASAAFNGFLSGTVTDARSGAPVPQAWVAAGTDASCPTQENGGYFLLHAPGVFTVIVTAPGYREWSRSVTLEEGAGLTVDAALIPDDGPPGPDPPVIRYPGDGAVDVPPAPRLEIGEFHHADAARRHARTRWRVAASPDDATALDLVSTDRLTGLDVPAFVLLPQETYRWRAQVEDDTGAASPWSTGAAFSVMEDAGPDADGNGVPDGQDVSTTVDLDGNGVSDLSQKDLRAVRTSTGRLTALGMDGAGCRVILLRAEAVPANPPPGKADGDAVRFRALVEKPGHQGTVTLWRNEAIPDGIRWFFHSSGGAWESTPAVRAAHGRSVTFAITDGGGGDLDGAANGVVVGLAASTAPSSGDDGDGGGGGGGCFLREIVSGDGNRHP